MAPLSILVVLVMVKWSEAFLDLAGDISLQDFGHFTGDQLFDSDL